MTAVKVELPLSGSDNGSIKSKGFSRSITSPTLSDSSKRSVGLDKGLRNDYLDGGEYDAALFYDDGEQSPMVDWLTDSPTNGRYEMAGNVKRDSLAVYNFNQDVNGISPRTPGFGKPNQGSQDGRGISPQAPAFVRPSIKTNGLSPPPAEPTKHLSPDSRSLSPSPNSSNGASPMARYRGWVSEVLAPLEDFIDHYTDPRELFANMQEIAEGESGSVFCANVVGSLKPGSKKVLPEDGTKLVAIKSIPLVPGGSQKLLDLREELALVSCVRHENILSMDGLYVDLTEDCLWIRMELMERSLADMLQLSEEGFVLHEPVIAQFTRDVRCSLAPCVHFLTEFARFSQALKALTYLESIGVAHRDVRSDNLLVSNEGALKLADFSNAVQLEDGKPMRSDVVGVVYWQAPEMRRLV